MTVAEQFRQEINPDPIIPKAVIAKKPASLPKSHDPWQEEQIL